MTKTNHADTGKDGRRYPLTQRQEEFCRAVIELDGNASEAYRRAYPASKTWQDKSVWERASHLLAIAKVRARLEKLREAARKRSKTTVDSITAKLAAAYDMAKKHKQGSAMTSAALGEAKLHGLLIDKKMDVTPPADLSDAEIDTELGSIEEELASLGTRH